MPLEKKEVIPFLAIQLQKQAFTEIRSQHNAHPSPNGIKWEKDAQSHYPDITAMKGEAVGVFNVIEDPASLTQSDFNKFKLFSAFASQRKGKHFLVAELSDVESLTGICKTHAIQADILPIERTQKD